jgi:hypothetical protein
VDGRARERRRAGADIGDATSAALGEDEEVGTEAPVRSGLGAADGEEEISAAVFFFFERRRPQALHRERGPAGPTRRTGVEALPQSLQRQAVSL